MAKASANLYPYVHLVPAAAPASPAAGSQRLYLDSGDSNKLKRKDSTGTVTTIEGGGGGGSSVYTGVKVYQTAAYNLANTTVTAVPWDTEDWDTDAFHDTSSLTTRLVVPSGKAGKYMVSATIATGAALSGRFIGLIAKNGTVVRGGSGEASIGSSSSNPAVNIACEVSLAVSDYIELHYYQDSGSVKAMALDKSGLSMHLIG